MIERDFYPLYMLAERWTCTVHDLLHLGIQGRVQVCANIYGMVTGISRTRMDTDFSEMAPDDMPDGVFELEHEDLRFLDMPDALPYELHEALKFDRGWWVCEFDPPVSINHDHLCMLHQEVQRLDREVFAVGDQVSETLAESAPMPNKSLSTRERHTMLRLIGGC